MISHFMRILGLSVTALLITLVISACSVPNLESTTCTDARDAVRHFYSFHFGNDMTPSSENLAARKDFLTPQYYQTITSASNGKTDPFTLSDDFPKTFKIAQCEESADENKRDLEVQIYWRTDERTTQKELKVSMVKDGKWLISGISPK